MTQKINVSRQNQNAETAGVGGQQFSSDYGTLKYTDRETASITIDVDDLDTVGQATITHNLGYYPFVEVYMLNPIGEYEYVPSISGGAGTTWDVYVNITKTTVKLYVEQSGFASDPTFDFIVFIFKNNVGL